MKREESVRRESMQIELRRVIFILARQAMERVCQYAAPPGTPGFDPHETELLGTNGLKRLTEVHHNERARGKKKTGYMKASCMNSVAAAVLRNCYGAEIPAVDVAGNAHIFQGVIRKSNTTKVAILRIKYSVMSNRQAKSNSVVLRLERRCSSCASSIMIPLANMFAWPFARVNVWLRKHRAEVLGASKRQTTRPFPKGTWRVYKRTGAVDGAKVLLVSSQEGSPWARWFSQRIGVRVSLKPLGDRHR
ncbi:uncharacterized protein Triagg1_1879 [Trichoderma aggressivum f. europaeum]|uniref:Uncharacterized protein n=1 Tax=Trichoderma aggressivum f. europaeum TaxID=173218 RepID=A0AAE1IJ49_9HYPO|nr:hypothetical protein Triagg1_1879 [Trichoderma aggressivum f. europaeum]